jgi:hypothetical protein
MAPRDRTGSRCILPCQRFLRLLTNEAAEKVRTGQQRDTSGASVSALEGQVLALYQGTTLVGP